MHCAFWPEICDGECICLQNGRGSKAALLLLCLTQMFVSFPAVQVNGTQATQNESVGAPSTKRSTLPPTTSPQKNTSPSETSSKSWKYAFHFLMQHVQKILNLSFICCSLSQNEGHLLIHAGYKVFVPSNYEVLMSDGRTSKDSVRKLNVITGGYKLR